MGEKIMKLLITGDWHYTDKQVKNRLDNYSDTLNNKIRYILNAAAEKNLPILQPGDMTDTALLSYSAFSALLSLLKKTLPEIYYYYTVRGQHDLLYRNAGNTPLDALVHAAPNLHIVKEPIHISPDVCLYGTSFEEDMPEIQDHKKFNILLIHRLIINQYKEEWEKSHPLSSTLLNSTDFDLIVSGDNHQGFIYSTKNKQRFLINCGSLMRSNIDQIFHKPFFCIFDTDKRTYEQHFIPIINWEEVFDPETKVKEDQKNEMLVSLVANLSQHKKFGLSFTDNLISFMEENKIEPSVRDMVNWSLSYSEKT
jgi:DNA repair exonuclease SbcCD nuclease subunit